MKDKSLLIHNAVIVNEGQRFRGSVLIAGDKISEVFHDETKPAVSANEEIDACGAYLIPGTIDCHVHFREPGLTAKADIGTESAAAAAGGVTSYMDMPNCVPQTTTLEALEDKFKTAAEKSAVNYSFYFGATNNNASLLAELDKTRVCGVKVFMGASTGNMLVDRLDVLRKIFSSAGKLIAAHCEDQNVIRKNTESFRRQYGDDLDISLHPLIRSEEACWNSSSLAVSLAKETGARLHVLHISTARELSLFDNSLPLREKRITAEACISHLMFCDEDYSRLGALIKCNPSVKTRADRDAIRKALASGVIDTIGTDHAPHLLTEKKGGALKAVSGLPSIQFSLVSIMELVSQGILSMEQLVQKMCHNPAILYGVKGRGYIRKGYQADLVLVNPDKEWTVTKDCILSKCGWSPFEGHTFTSKVERTFVNGELVYDGHRVIPSVRGKELVFER